MSSNKRKSLFRLFGLSLIGVSILAAGIYLQARGRGAEIAGNDSAALKRANHLAGEKSPYLLQHAHNPVDWYPWGEEALSKAKRENKPIFLSIGYASCHWCHVMERESFENDEIAALLNKDFVSIKVDREERPDLDHIYMTVTTMMTGSGGWPMSVFLSPNLIPFYAGTYFPPEGRYGRPGFKQVITELARLYQSEPGKIQSLTAEVHRRLQQEMWTTAGGQIPDPSLISSGVDQLLARVDTDYGGFGTGTKFPQPPMINLLIRHFKTTGNREFLDPALSTLKAMARGGIFDHIGGGFHRYSVDRYWKVPHFEKMLYDNALLVPLYCDAFQITKDSSFLETAQRTLDFLLRDMRGDKGQFYSAFDADSEGEEGKYYTWSRHELDEILGERAENFCTYYNVSASGNFEGENILYVSDKPVGARSSPDTPEWSRLMSESREVILQRRSQRVPPLLDDKSLTSWNGLALGAMARGYEVTGDSRYLAAALEDAQFVKENMYVNGYLLHSYRNGKKDGRHFLEDYAFYIHGLLLLAEVDAKDADKWVELASKLADTALELFADQDGRLYLREKDVRDLIVRPQDERDSAIPAPGSILIEALLKLDRFTGLDKYGLAAEKSLSSLGSTMTKGPTLVPTALMALDYLLNDKIEIVLVGMGPIQSSMMSEVYSRYLPNAIVAVSDNGRSSIPLFEGRAVEDGIVRAYVCINSVCKFPVSTVTELRRQLDEL